MDRGSIPEIVYLFRASNELRPIILLGAGASFRSGIPLASDATIKIAKASFARTRLGVDWRATDKVMISDWKPYLKSQTWFPQFNDDLSAAFPYAVKHLLVPKDFRREFLLDMIKPKMRISGGYVALADLVFRRLCGTVLTTNFDNLIVESLREHRPQIPQINEVNRMPGDIVVYNAQSRCQIVYLHGSAEYYTDKILAEETSQLDSRLVSFLHGALRDAPLLVVGYRGAEQSIMRHLLSDGISATNSFHHGIWWCTAGKEELNPLVDEFANSIGGNFRLVPIAGFDELFGEILGNLKDEFSFQTVTRSNEAIAQILLSDPPVKGKSYDDLDEDLIKSTLTKYFSRLELGSLDSTNHLAFLETQGFLIRDSGVLRPTTQTYLLFGKNPNDLFPYAQIVFQKDGKKQTVFEGNILHQFSSVLELLSNSQHNPILRIKREKTSEERQAYPVRAITELAVNLLVHRNYDLKEFSYVEYDTGKGISFIAPGGIPEKLKERLVIEPDGKFEPVRDLSEIRNPKLADVFYGIGAMDKAGSGLSDVKQLMVSYDGNAEFYIRSNNSSLCSNLRQAVQQSPDKSNVATPVVKTEIYTTNLLPISVLPESVFIFPLEGAYNTLEPISKDSETLPIIIIDWKAKDPCAISFADLRRYRRSIPTSIRVDDADEAPIGEYLENKDRRSKFVWLVGKHIESYMDTFSKDGLLMESFKKRAYFTIVSGQENRITYSSRLGRKTTRSVVKKREIGRKLYFENEGIGFSVESYGKQWSIRVKPFYMFTGKDGRTPLPPFLRTKYSTWRIKYDRNKNVDDDIHFWTKYLSQGQPTFNIGGEGVDNLIVEAANIECEIPASTLT